MNVTALVNTSGDVVERYSYDPYGRVTVRHGVIDAAGQDTSANEWTERTAGEFTNAILYAGYFYDDETGLFHVRNRTYHPTLGRWLQRDPAGYVDGMSLYEYVSSTPVAAGDPTGLRTWLPGRPKQDVEWKLKEHYFFRSLMDGKCREFYFYHGEAEMGTVLTRFGHSPGGNVLLTIYDGINKVPLKIPVVSTIQTWVNAGENLSTASRARSQWKLVGVYHAVDVYVSECPQCCECNSSYCLRRYPYKFEREANAIDRIEYRLDKELVLPGESESARDLQDKSTEAVKAILEEIIGSV